MTIYKYRRDKFNNADCAGFDQAGQRGIEYLISCNCNVRYNASMDSRSVIQQTKAWLRTVVIGLNFCPFAGRVFDNDTIHYRVAGKSDFGEALEALYQELLYLDENAEMETSLVIFAEDFADFDDYLDLLAMGEALLQQHGYEGVYQLASFHPDYVFANSDADDAANYTNRSPFPMLHLIRETGLEKALQNYPDPDQIPERNMREARKLGTVQMQALLDVCKQSRE